jgi:hypothetical protein
LIEDLMHGDVTEMEIRRESTGSLFIRMVAVLWV